VSAPFSEPLQAPDEFAQHGGAPYNATNLTDKTATAAVREMEPARWRPLVEQVAGEINGHIRIGKQEAIMQLDPPELGKLRIDLHLDGDRLEARILAETPESRALIETHLPELRRILGENRVELVDVRIDSGSWSSAGGDGHGWPRQEANGGYQPTNDFGGVLGVGAEEREPERRQPEAHEPGRVSMWA
jgi:flagellar hook-length control protein FliK